MSGSILYAAPVQRSLAVVLLSSSALGCGTVDVGAYQGVRDLELDEAYFYCVVQPKVLTARRCSGGDPAAGDSAGGCHSSASSLRLSEPAALVACESGKPKGPPSAEERANFGAASLRATRDPESSPLLVRPTGVDHPRKIFEKNSPEADLLRTWIARAR